MVFKKAQGSSCDPDVSINMTVRALSVFVLGFFLFAIQGCVDCAGLYKKFADTSCSATVLGFTAPSTIDCSVCKSEWNALKDICSCKCSDYQTTDAMKTLCSAGTNPDFKTSYGTMLSCDADSGTAAGSAICP